MKLTITAASIPSDLKPVVAFNLTDAKGSPLRLSDVDEGGLRFLNAAIVPDPDTNSTKYVNYVVNRVTGRDYQSDGKAVKAPLESATQAAVDTGGVFTDLGSGRFTYKFSRAAPADFNVGTTHAIGGYATRDARAYVSNDAFYFVPAGGPVEVMREVVKTSSCNACHETLGLHGGTRRNTELCVLCHNPTNTDIVKRTQAKGPMPPESISFGRMVHRIHTGEEQQDKPFIIYGSPSTNIQPINLSEARFPTDRRNCFKCHLPNTNLLSFMRKDAGPTVIKQGDTLISSIPPIQSVCTGCHDNSPAITHTQAQTVNGKESCVVCHNEGREFAVSKAHAR